MSYSDDLVARFWTYKQTVLGTCCPDVEEQERRGCRPPVFLKAYASKNVLLHPALSSEQRSSVLAMIPQPKRHKWFRSMKSSQALAQSIFGNLAVLNKMDILAALVTTDGQQPFAAVTKEQIRLEHGIKYLGEVDGRITEVDVLFDAPVRIAVECKLAEDGVGSCSRTTSKAKSAERCTGAYRVQRQRNTRCSLTELGIKYWDYIPRLFNWADCVDHDPCPVNLTYQLVRNVLAAAVSPDGSLIEGGGVAVLLHDARNPAFQTGGRGDAAFHKVRAALRCPLTLQRLTWQAVLTCMRSDPSLDGLTKQVLHKYGI